MPPSIRKCAHNWRSCVFLKIHNCSFLFLSLVIDSLLGEGGLQELDNDDLTDQLSQVETDATGGCSGSVLEPSPTRNVIDQLSQVETDATGGCSGSVPEPAPTRNVIVTETPDSNGVPHIRLRVSLSRTEAHRVVPYKSQKRSVVPRSPSPSRKRRRRADSDTERNTGGGSAEEGVIGSHPPAGTSSCTDAQEEGKFFFFGVHLYPKIIHPSFPQCLPSHRR
jgi:hypothetical protein